MLLEDSPPPDETKKRVWPCRLQIPIGILIVGLVGGGVLCFLSLADSKNVERVKAGNISLGDFQERDRRHLLLFGGTFAPLGEADCWNPCGRKGGVCQHYCGHKGFCCRKGFDDCPVLASEWASPLRHTCVNFGKFDCTDTFKNRLASFEYNYYPGYWLANWSGIVWASSSEAKSNKKFQWILHDCGGDSVCMESKKPYWKNLRFLGIFEGYLRMWRVVTDLSDGSNEKIQHRIFCDSCNPGGLENTTFSNCEIINKAGYLELDSWKRNGRLASASASNSYLRYCSSDCRYDSWVSWRIESPPTRVYWKVVFDHCNRGTTNETLTYTMQTSITTSTSTTTEVTVGTKISFGLEAGKLLEAVGRTLGGELGASFKWSRTDVEQLAQSTTIEISTQLEPGMKWVVRQAMGEAGWTSIATKSSTTEKIPC